MPPKVSLTEPPFTYKWTRAQLGRAADNEATASLAEAVNPKVDGSSPSGGAIYILRHKPAKPKDRLF